MSESPLLNKMDALLKKHRGAGDDNGTAGTPMQTTAPAPKKTAPDGTWLPVLTHVIQRGTPPTVPMTSTAPAGTPMPPTAAVEPPAGHDNAAVSDTLAEQLLGELTPRLSEVMEKQVAAELRKNLDQTVATLLSQLDVNVREIVREAVNEKLKQPRDPSS